MWFKSALWTTVRGGLVALAAVGAAATYAVVMLVSGKWGPDEVMAIVEHVDHAKAWLAGMSGGGVLAAMARHGLPVLSGYMAERRAANTVLLAEQVASMIAKRNPR